MTAYNIRLSCPIVSSHRPALPVPIASVAILDGMQRLVDVAIDCEELLLLEVGHLDLPSCRGLALPLATVAWRLEAGMYGVNQKMLVCAKRAIHESHISGTCQI